MAEISEGKLLVDGYVYVRSRVRGNRAYWDCQRTKMKQCTARAVSNNPKPGEDVVIYRGPTVSVHSHPPNREEAAAIKVTQSLKRKAAENPGQPPSQILRTELPLVSHAVLSQLPEREALAKAMRRERRRHLPTNPRSLRELEDIPERFQKTFLNERFLMYDSRDEDVEEEEQQQEDEEDEGRDRVLVFSTRRNIELLCASPTWFMDGTFKTAPTLFTQVFTILGLRRRNVVDGEGLAVPLVYALLTRKTTEQYTTVLRVVQEAVDEFNVAPCNPARFMTDFEKSILNACTAVYPTVTISCCFFHLGQSVYRRVQKEGLQEAYNNPEDRTLKVKTHMLLALAFVPVPDVPATFRLLKNAWPEANFKPIMTYFDSTYVNGIPARGRRAAVAPRYPPHQWNQYESAVNKSHRTNNVSEAWHQRFQVVVGRHHPDMFSALGELQKEQGDTESIIAELAMGRKVRALPKKKWVTAQERIQGIVAQYESYINDDKVIDYLRTLSYNIDL